MQTVYVVQDTGKNFEAAKKFGRLKICSFGKDDRIVSQQKLEYALQHFQNRDFLLLVGDPILIGVAVHQLFMRYPKIPCLVWDRESQEYQIENIEMQNIDLWNHK